jgi:hypothetical protein
MAVLVPARKPPPPRRRAQIGGTALLGLLAVVELLAGRWVSAVIIAAATVLLVSAVALSDWRAAARQPDWIEVRPDRIVAVRSAGTGWELLRTPDSILRVHDLGGQPLLSLGALGGDDTIPLDRFDVDEVRRATVATGWQCAPPAGSTPVGRSAVDPSPDANEKRIQLRDGSSRLPHLSAEVAPKAAIAFAVAVALGAVAAGFAGVSSTAIVFAVVGVAAALGVTVAALAALSVRRISLTIRITPDRVTLSHGTLTSQVVQRSAVASATVGSRWARLRDPNGKALLWLPLRPHRDDIVNALARNGWPTSESPGGLRRHL